MKVEVLTAKILDNNPNMDRYQLAIAVAKRTDELLNGATSKLNVLKVQRNQLNQCLDKLLTEVKLKQRTFRVYHQFKMYNDPKLNPELYAGQKIMC